MSIYADFDLSLILRFLTINETLFNSENSFLDLLILLFEELSNDRLKRSSSLFTKKSSRIFLRLREIFKRSCLMSSFYRDKKDIVESRLSHILAQFYDVKDVDSDSNVVRIFLRSKSWLTVRLELTDVNDMMRDVSSDSMSKREKSKNDWSLIEFVELYLSSTDIDDKFWDKHTESKYDVAVTAFFNAIVLTSRLSSSFCSCSCVLSYITA
jgi:hypothetical protein